VTGYCSPRSIIVGVIEAFGGESGFIELHPNVSLISEEFPKSRYITDTTRQATS
jgi:hypothetical protein